MARTKTLFNVFGISRRATDEQVHQRWLSHLEEASGEDRVPDTIRFAYRVLANAPLRRLYRDLLDQCEGKTPLIIEPDKVRGFKNFCKRVDISVFKDRDPKLPHWFHVRLPHQKPPRWVKAKQGTTFGSGFLKKITDVLTFRVFTGRSGGAQFFLTLLYVTVIFGAAVGTRWTFEIVRQELAQMLEADVRSLEATVADEYRDLLHARTHFASDFQSATTLSLDDIDPGHRPRDFDLALIRHESARTAWCSIHDTEQAFGKLIESGEVVTSVENHIRVSSFLKQDRARLVEALATIREGRSALDRQEQWLGHLQRILAADHFESAAVQ